MFRALKRFFSAILYVVTFGLVKMSEDIESHPGVIKARYDEVIQDKVKRIQEFMEAVSEIIRIREQKKVSLKSLTEEVKRLEALKQGAAAKAKKATASLQKAGKASDEIKQDPEFLRCQSAYKDFSSTLAEKLARIEELESDISGYDQKVEGHQRDLTNLKRDIEKIKAEKGEAVADIITAKQEKEVADLLSGIADDGSAETLQGLRDQREKAKAEAKVAEGLAGTDSRRQEEEFLAHAAADESNDEFAALMGLSEPEEEVPAPAADKANSSLPE